MLTERQDNWLRKQYDENGIKVCENVRRAIDDYIDGKCDVPKG